MFSTIFVAVPALQTGRPGDDFRSDCQGDGEIDVGLQLCVRIAGDEDDLGPALARPREATTDELRHAAGRDANHDVFSGGANPGHRSSALFVVVLNPLASVQQRLLTAGDDREHHLFARAERRWHLGRFEHAEASAGTRADEDDPAPLAQSLGKQIGRKGDADLLALHRREDLAILADHEVDDVRGRGPIDGQAIGIDGLGRQRLPFRDWHDRLGHERPPMLPACPARVNRR